MAADDGAVLQGLLADIQGLLISHSLPPLTKPIPPFLLQLLHITYAIQCDRPSVPFLTSFLVEHERVSITWALPSLLELFGV